MDGCARLATTVVFQLGQRPCRRPRPRPRWTRSATARETLAPAQTARTAASPAAFASFSGLPTDYTDHPVALRPELRRNGISRAHHSGCARPASTRASQQRLPVEVDRVADDNNGEGLVIQPKPEWSANAWFKNLDQYQAQYDRSVERSRGLLGRARRRRPGLDQEVGQGPRLELRARPLHQVVRGRRAQRGLQLPRPPRRGRQGRQGRHHLRRRPRRYPHLDLQRAARRRQALRQRAQEARRQEG